ncbi:unnamed protein product, partial [Vitis vinifera]
MVPNQNFTRIDTLELKALIVRRIGRQKAEKYFDQLKRLFSLKLSKREFDKFCLWTIGRENIPLHNRLIGSILKNACLSKVPPLKGRNVGVPKDVKVANGYQRNCLHVACEELASKAQEQQNGEEVEQLAGSPSVQSRSPVRAPFGISMNMGGRKSLCNGSICNYHPETCHNSGELPDTGSLRSHLERKLEMEGFGVSMDCVNLLNNSLDVFLKRLIEPCLQLKSRKPKYASVLDFRVAMELNPQILGEDWPIQLEKICLHASEE